MSERRSLKEILHAIWSIGRFFLGLVILALVGDLVIGLFD